MTREQILAFRRRVGGLEARLPAGRRSLREAAWAGLKDSMPRAAVLSLHARVAGIGPAAWEDPALVQLWGPGYHAYVVAAGDVGIFTLGRLPDAGGTRRVAEDLAARLWGLLGETRMTYSRAGRALGESPNRLRYAALTGTVLLRWDGARQPVIWTVPPPEIEPGEARLELARRYLRVFGPGTAEGFARWAGIPRPQGVAVFDALGKSLIPVVTPIGEARVLARDEATLRAGLGAVGPARLLPSGDAYFLLHGADREVLVPDARRRDYLWTSRVWPGAVLVGGEVAGTWRRAQNAVTVSAWRGLSREERHAVEAEAASLPLPGGPGQVVVRWEE